MDSLDKDIILKAAQGDIDAFEQIYRAYVPFVYNVAYRMMEAREDAEEVTQEVFVIVHQRLNSFLFRSSLKTWVYRITANCAINALKKRSRDHQGQVELENILPVMAGPDEMKAKIEGEDRKDKVERLLTLLNDDERACIVLRNIEGLSYEDIARSLSVNINTVRTRLKRAREKMLSLGQEVIGYDM